MLATPIIPIRIQFVSPPPPAQPSPPVDFFPLSVLWTYNPKSCLLVHGDIHFGFGGSIAIRETEYGIIQHRIGEKFSHLSMIGFDEGSGDLYIVAMPHHQAPLTLMRWNARTATTEELMQTVLPVCLNAGAKYYISCRPSDCALLIYDLRAVPANSKELTLPPPALSEEKQISFPRAAFIDDDTLCVARQTEPAANGLRPTKVSICSLGKGTISASYDFEFPGRLKTVNACKQKRVFVLVCEDLLYAIDMDTLEIRWQSPILPDWSTVFSNDGKIAFMSSPQDLTAARYTARVCVLDSRSGVELAGMDVTKASLLDYLAPGDGEVPALAEGGFFTIDLSKQTKTWKFGFADWKAGRQSMTAQYFSRPYEGEMTRMEWIRRVEESTWEYLYESYPCVGPFFYQRMKFSDRVIKEFSPGPIFCRDSQWQVTSHKQSRGQIKLSNGDSWNLTLMANNHLRIGDMEFQITTNEFVFESPPLPFEQPSRPADDLVVPAPAKPAVSKLIARGRKASPDASDLLCQHLWVRPGKFELTENPSSLQFKEDGTYIANFAGSKEDDVGYWTLIDELLILEQILEKKVPENSSSSTLAPPPPFTPGRLTRHKLSISTSPTTVLVIDGSNYYPQFWNFCS